MQLGRTAAGEICCWGVLLLAVILARPALTAERKSNLRAGRRTANQAKSSKASRCVTTNRPELLSGMQQQRARPPRGARPVEQPLLAARPSLARDWQLAVVLLVTLLTPGRADPERGDGHLLMAHGRRGLLQGATAVATACSQSVLVLPAVGGESIHSTSAVVRRFTGASAVGACLALTGNTTLYHLDTGAAFSLQGTVVFWVPGESAACPSLANATAAARQFFLGHGLVPATPSWGSATCCSGSATCAGLSDLSILHSPPLNSEPTPQDWLVLQGYATTAQVPMRTTELQQQLYGDPPASTATWQACRSACARRPGCAAFQWRAANGTCLMLANEPAAGRAAVAPCGGAEGSASECVYGYRLAGSCGRTASAGIWSTGARPPEWQPVKNAWYSRWDEVESAMWNMQGVPDDAQGLPAAAPSECNCRCGSLSGCVAYLWRGSDFTCWMFTQFYFFEDTESDASAATVIGRVDTGRQLARCGRPPTEVWAFINQTYPDLGSGRIVSEAQRQPFASTYEGCYLACSAEAACVISVFDGPDITAGTAGNCTLYSEALPGSRLIEANFTNLQVFKRCDNATAPRLVPYPPLATLTWTVSASNATTLGPLRALPSGGRSTQPTAQACLAACNRTAGCGAAVYDVAGGNCTLAYFAPANATAAARAFPRCLNASGGTAGVSNATCMVVARSEGFCGLTASSGIVGIGQRWRGWRAGAALGTWGSAVGIETVVQGRSAPTASDCLCWCANSAACAAYVWLGVNQTCWLQSEVNVAEGLEPDASPLTISGRIETTGFERATCTSAPALALDRAPANGPSTTNILRAPNPFPAANATVCSAACLMEPFCQAFTVRPVGTAGLQTCTLFSSASGGTVTQPGTSLGFAQRCLLTLPGPPPPPTAPASASPPAAGAPPSPPTTDQSSGGGGGGDGGGGTSSAVLGAAIGAAVGGTALLALIAAFVVVRRNKKRQAEAAAAAAAATQQALSKGLPPDGPMPPPGYPSAQGPPSSLWNGTVFQAGGGALRVGVDGSYGGGVRGLPPAGSTQGSGFFSPDGSQGVSALGPPSGYGVAIRERRLSTGSLSSVPHVSSKEIAQLSGLVPGDPFLISVAPSYRWCALPLDGMAAIEEGINAASRAASVLTDKHPGRAKWKLPAGSPGPPPVRLTAAQVQQQVEIMAAGMIDRGATAIVFKCRWPGMFGPKSLLAIKMLRDPHGYQASTMIEAFQYEADVLARCRHPNVVRIYGWCVEPPTVCIIMELLPSSLKQRLYPPERKPSPGSPMSAAADPADTLGTGVTRGSSSAASELRQPSANLPHQASCLSNASGTAAAQPGTPTRLASGSDSQTPATPPQHATSAPFLTMDSGNGSGSGALGAAGSASGTLPLPGEPRSGAISVDQFNRQSTGAAEPPPSNLSASAGAGRGSAGAMAAAALRAGAVGATSLSATGHVDDTKMSGKTTASGKARRARSKYVEPQEPLTVAEMLQLGADIAAGLAHLHAPKDARDASALQTVVDGAEEEEEDDDDEEEEGEGEEGEGREEGAARSGVQSAVGGSGLSGIALERVVHRDLKPANILINSQGRAKISDFGLAREHANTSIHTEHHGAGTLRYMAPELMSGAAQTSMTDKVDIYSLGILLWEMAAKEVPWKGCSDTHVPLLVQSGQRPPLSKATVSASGGATNMSRTSVSSSSIDDTAFVQLPQYTAVVRSCWQQHAHRRPTAAAVHKQLAALQELHRRKLQEQQQHQLVLPPSSQTSQSLPSSQYLYSGPNVPSSGNLTPAGPPLPLLGTPPASGLLASAPTPPASFLPLPPLPPQRT